MYAAYSKADNQLSPRSKVLSVGLTSMEPTPLRFRPLAKAADYFRDEELRAPSDQSRAQGYRLMDTGGGDFKNLSGSGSPSDEELRSQYTEFQRKLIAEQLSQQNDFRMAPSDRPQALTKAVDITGDLSPRSLRPKYNAYTSQLERDQNAAIEQTRKKFVRNIDEDSANMVGLAIGRQLDKDALLRSKRDQQMAYQQQLVNDARAKPVVVDRKPVERRVASPQNRHVSLMEQIGNHSDGSGLSESESRRREAQRVLTSNRDDVLARLAEGRSPENQKLRQASMYSRNDEAAKFEEAPYHFIGATSEGTKDRKKAMQEQYLAQLLADNGPPSQGRTARREDDSLFSDRTGWTGLHVGGHSMDEANRSEASNEKHQKQAAYKRLLDQQKVVNDNAQRADSMRYGRY
jgi:hypothetical protein